MKQLKGSKRCMIELISSVDYIPNINSFLEPTGAKVGSVDLFMPKGLQDHTEAELKNFLKDHFNPNLGIAIAKWWLALPQYRTPNWDLVSTCTIDGGRGILLVEAKAHWNELKENDQCGSSSEENRSQILNAIISAKTAINDKINPTMVLISRDKCYQLSNRIAHAWWLANNGIPVVLMYLGFKNCEEMKDNGMLFNNDSDWQKCFKSYSSKVGVEALLNIERVDCGKSWFKLICRSY